MFGDTGLAATSAWSTTPMLPVRISSETPVSWVRWSSASNICRFAVASRCRTPYSMPARFRPCASCFCELSSVASVRSSASAASYSRRIASATCATSAWIFASAVCTARPIFTISGWFGPSFSDNCARCRCSCASSAFCCWTNGLESTVGRLSTTPGSCTMFLTWL